MKTTKKKSDNFLLYVPKKKHTTWEERKGKVFLIFHHDKLIERFMRWLVKKPTVTDIELDDMASFVWKLIDGQKTMGQIMDKMREKYGDKCEPLEERLGMYISYLNRRGWISFSKGNQ